MKVLVYTYGIANRANQAKLIQDKTDELKKKFPWLGNNILVIPGDREGDYVEMLDFTYPAPPLSGYYSTSTPFIYNPATPTTGNPGYGGVGGSFNTEVNWGKTVG
jgi:hypothetical protein